MTVKEQLIQEIEGVPDYIAQEMLNFCLFLKTKIQTQATPAESSDILNFLDDVDAISQDIPADKLATLPVDLSKNLDHYLYGTPKIERPRVL